MFIPLPTKVSDVHNAVESVEHVTTHRGENFVLWNNLETHVIIFGCESSPSQLHAADIILTNGTFIYCPKLFAQAFTFHCAANGH